IAAWPTRTSIWRGCMRRRGRRRRRYGIWGSTSGSRTSEQLRELLRQHGADPFFFVLEKYERVLPAGAELLHAIGPALQVALLVTFVPQAEIAPVGGDHIGCGALARVGDAQGGVAALQEVIDVVGKPRLVAEFPGAADLLGHQAQHLTEPVRQE